MRRLGDPQSSWALYAQITRDADSPGDITSAWLTIRPMSDQNGWTQPLTAHTVAMKGRGFKAMSGNCCWQQDDAPLEHTTRAA